MSSPTFGVVLLCLIIALGGKTDSAEYFSSMDTLQKLGDIELNLVQSLQDYLETQQETIGNYRKFLQHVRSQHTLAAADTEDYLGNPINAFTLIKRMVSDWKMIHDMVNANDARDALTERLSEIEQEIGMPDMNDLSGAVRGFVRLQKVYNLSSTALANGEFSGVSYGPQLDWQDCFEIARIIFEEKNYLLAVSWFETTLLALLDDEETVEERLNFELDAYEYIALSHFKLGNMTSAIAYLDKILAVKSDHTAQELKDYMLLSQPKTVNVTATVEYSSNANYTRLCRGIRLTETVSNELHCKVDTKDNPYLILAPVKVEMVSLDPQINIYHGILTDDQIETIMNEAGDDMFRSRVRNGTESIKSEVRISQQTWLEYKSPIMQAVKRLVTQISGLDLENAESMQVANYGIGGQYNPHHDFFPEKDNLPFWLGNRIATNMFYFSNVEEGGYTVFPYLDIYLRPVQGALVEWYNLHKSVDADYRTFHAGCPVIRGSKRIGNIWIHSGLQELRRPCDLVSDTHKSAAYIE